ncbi:hypothetical protein DM860_006055 [Cuscuta australis]|uniref:Uncharacterized protein n=1 Tax=Cuscuta australis TaxID=267555 RepID=A0A328DNY1_9ASTE|nr:hypothetical protein DM860_006055 [Cuscuta australis]
MFRCYPSHFTRSQNPHRHLLPIAISFPSPSPTALRVPLFVFDLLPVSSVSPSQAGNPGIRSFSPNLSLKSQLGCPCPHSYAVRTSFAVRSPTLSSSCYCDGLTGVLQLDLRDTAEMVS